MRARRRRQPDPHPERGPRARHGTDREGEDDQIDEDAAEQHQREHRPGQSRDGQAGGNEPPQPLRAKRRPARRECDQEPGEDRDAAGEPINREERREHDGPRSQPQRGGRGRTAGYSSQCAVNS